MFVNVLVSGFIVLFVCLFILFIDCPDNLTQARLIWGEGSSTGKMPPSDCLQASLWDFLFFPLMIDVGRPRPLEAGLPLGWWPRII